MSHGVTPRRGEVWWTALDPTLGSEIAKTDAYVRSFGRVASAQPTSDRSRQFRGAIAKERLQSRIGVLAEPEMEALGHALQQILDLI